MATHSSTLAWQIPWMEEPGGLQSMGSLRVGHEREIEQLQFHFHFSLSCIGEGNGNPLQCSCLENPRDRRAWWAVIYGVVSSQTWLKRLSSSSSSMKQDPWTCNSGAFSSHREQTIMLIALSSMSYLKHAMKITIPFFLWLLFYLFLLHHFLWVFPFCMLCFWSCVWSKGHCPSFI